MLYFFLCGTMKIKDFVLNANEKGGGKMGLQTNEDGMKTEGNEDPREVVDDYGDIHFVKRVYTAEGNEDFLFMEEVYITDDYGNSVRVWREIGELYEE